MRVGGHISQMIFYCKMFLWKALNLSGSLAPLLPPPMYCNSPVQLNLLCVHVSNCRLLVYMLMHMRACVRARVCVCVCL